MATTYTNPSFNDGPWQRAFGDWLIMPEEAARTYVVNDVVKGPQVGIAAKLCDAILAIESLDSDASPAGILKVQLTNGTTTVDVIVLTAAQVKAGGVFRITERAAVGYVTGATSTVAPPWWLQAKMTTGPATGASGKLKFGGYFTGMNYKGEDPTAPTG